MDKEALKKRVCDAIDANRDRICQIGHAIYDHPELGYKEFFASAKVKEVFNDLKLPYEDGLAITGLKAKLKEHAPGPNIAIMGELDAVVCPDHPKADPSTGAAHCCGHFAQTASMLGAAIGLCAVKDEIDFGNVTFLAVPAEECVEIEWRKEQIRAGKIQYLGGKQELLHLGVYDDIDLAMMVHGTGGHETVCCSAKSVGFIAKNVKFIGKEAHAGAAPWDGVNALNAASLSLMAINSIRETLKAQDCIRIHPIITKGGTLVNIVPNDVRMEMYVRGASIRAIKETNDNVNRAIRGCAYAIGCEVEIIDLPGYLPVSDNRELGCVFEENVHQLYPEMKTIHGTGIGGGSSDIGDVEATMPCIQAIVGGFRNAFHSKEFELADEELAFIAPAKLTACTALDLLDDHAAKAKEILQNSDCEYRPSNYDRIWEDIIGKESSNF